MFGPENDLERAHGSCACDTFFTTLKGKTSLRGGVHTPGRARVQVGVHELRSPGIRGKGTGAAQFPIESVSEQLAREQ